MKYQHQEDMTSKFVYTLLLAASLISCNGQNRPENRFTSAEPIQIHRFDKRLYQWIDSGDSILFPAIRQEYPAMIDIIGKGILNFQTPDAPGFRETLMKLYSEPTLKQLYQEAITRYDAIADIQQQLGNGFAYLKAHLPLMQVPAVYMHVSGLNQNVLVGDSLLSLSIDKYMGKEYPLYQEFFYDYQLQKMGRENVVPDYLTGWLMAEYPFAGKENVLLERMIYEGKIKYILSQALPETDPALLMGYTPQALAWNNENEAGIWKAIIERKHLYTPDLITTNRYFEDAPSTFLSNEAPGNLGSWIGWQIVAHYMRETASTVETLMQNNDAQDILTKSKYKTK